MAISDHTKDAFSLMANGVYLYSTFLPSLRALQPQVPFTLAQKHSLTDGDRVTMLGANTPPAVMWGSVSYPMTHV